MVERTVTIPQVSIIVPCYNAAQWLRETLTSVVAQTGVTLQLIVIDDGSTDASAEIVEHEFTQAELVRTAKGGASRARNLGLKRALGTYIQFLDADDLLLPHKLQDQMAHLERTGADVVYSDWQYLTRTPDGQFERAQVVTPQMRGEPALELFTHFWASNAAYLFRHAIIDQTNGFNEGLPILQDARLVLDCALYGARFTYLPGVYSLYRVHLAQISRNRPAFMRDNLTNANQVRAWWEQHGGITPERRAALIQVYGNLARMSYEIDPATFWRAYRAVLEWEPHYIPTEPKGLALASRVFGYPRAEAYACSYRRAKRAVLASIGRLPPEPIHSNVPH